MNEYNSVELTIDDLSKSERGSSFTNCIFKDNAEGKGIEGVDLAYTLFNGCTFNTTFKNCMMGGCEGDPLPGITTVVFDTPPGEGVRVKDETGHMLGKGDGSERIFKDQRVNIEGIKIYLDCVELDPSKYEVSGGIIESCNVSGWNSGARAAWLQECSLELTTDAEDTYQPYDGIPDIPADGTSSCSIFIKKVDREGNYHTDESDNDQVDIRCSRGSINALRVNLVNGEASVTLTSVTETCISNVEAWGSEYGSKLGKQTIDIQFAPVS